MCALIRFSAPSSLRCGCPVDTSAKQKHRPSWQARPPQGVRQSVLPLSSLRSRVSGCGNSFSFKGNTDSFTLRVQNDKPISYCKYIKCADMLCLPVIAKPRKRLWQSVSLLKGNTDSFALRVQNDKPISYFKYIRRADMLSFTCHCEAV